MKCVVEQVDLNTIAIMAAPLLVGVISGWLGGGSEGLKWALLLMLIPLLVASLLAIPLRRTYPIDVATAWASFDEIKNRSRDKGVQRAD